MVHTNNIVPLGVRERLRFELSSHKGYFLSFSSVNPSTIFDLFPTSIVFLVTIILH